MTKPIYKIGLSLSGGGAKGIAHLGVLQALEEFDLKPDIIAGVSAGSIIGALYADGKTPKDICQFFQESSFFKYVSIKPKKGLMSPKRFHDLLDGYLTAKTFEDLKIPLIINATELVEGKNVYFTTGTLIDKIVASASVPIFLNPAEIDGKIFVDGGIFCNMPAKIIRPKCETLIGVHVNPILSEGKIDSVSDVLERVYHLVIQANTIAEKKVCDIVIEPVKARNFGMFEISKSQQLFDIGYDAAMQTLSTLFNKSSKK
ncbi:MAG: phospholipase [Sphingobacteriia bacterium]|jgi:NTE family protein|nr:patatin-like phospholipase family protein [Paludibacteraceae bacterium]NCA78918.1 phospholipase [Sphingobacteriia bacterium]